MSFEIPNIGNTENDKYILTELIHKMISTIRTQQTCYNEVFQLANQSKPEKRPCHIQNCGMVFDVSPSIYDWSVLETKLRNIQPKIRQAREEREQRRRTHDMAVKSIQSEIEFLKSEIEALQNKTAIRAKSSTPAKRPYSKYTSPDNSLPL